jgi:hypothetical protein
MVKKHMKASDGKYHIHGHKFEKLEGSRAQVWHHTAHQTPGGLTRMHLVMNKHGRIVSRKQHKRGKSAIKKLFKLGFKPKKGTFKLFKRGHGSRKMRGGMVLGGPLAPQSYNGEGVGTSGVNLQFVAGNAA